MDTVHNNGRIGEQPDPDALKDLIDVTGAIDAALQGLVGALGAAELVALVGDHDAAAALGAAGNDAREAAWYLTRALVRLRFVS